LPFPANEFPANEFDREPSGEGRGEKRGGSTLSGERHQLEVESVLSGHSEVLGYSFTSTSGISLYISSKMLPAREPNTLDSIDGDKMSYTFTDLWTLRGFYVGRR
jgi:hypothetical protein